MSQLYNYGLGGTYSIVSKPGFSGYSGVGTSGYSGYSGASGLGYSGYSGSLGGDGASGWSGYSGYSGYSGISGFSGMGFIGTAGSIPFSTGSALTEDNSYLYWDTANKRLGVGGPYVPGFTKRNPTMTSNSLPSPYVVTSDVSGSSAYTSFSEGVNGANYYSANHEYLQIDLNIATTINSYQNKCQINGTDRAPVSWTLQGSNDAGNWTTLDSQTMAAAGWSNGETRTYFLASNATYRYYRWNVIGAGVAVEPGQLRLGYYNGFHRTNPTMTSNSAPSPAVTSDSQSNSSAYLSWSAGTFAVGYYGGNTMWLQQDVGRTLSITAYQITSYANGIDRRPTSWNLQGSSDGSNWTTVDSQTTTTGSWSQGEARYYILAGGTASYRYWRLNVTGASYIETPLVALGDYFTPNQQILAKSHIFANSAAEVVNIIQGATNQKGNLSEWRGYDGTVLASVSSAGVFSGAFSGYSGKSGFSGYSGLGLSGFSGYSGYSGFSGYSGNNGIPLSGTPCTLPTVNTSTIGSSYTSTEEGVLGNLQTIIATLVECLKTYGIVNS